MQDQWREKHESGNIHGTFEPRRARLSERFEEHQPDFSLKHPPPGPLP